MKTTEAGVLSTSELFFHTASETAKKTYFYLRCIGNFVCDENYAVDRQSYASYLILYVRRGKGYVYVDGKRTELMEGHFAIINCYQPHQYGTESGWEILWIHFTGVLAHAYFEVITQSKNAIILPPEPYAISRNLAKIYEMYQSGKGANEPLISKYITALLTEFVTYTGNDKKHSCHAAAIEEILTFITENITNSLSVEELAKKASLSPYYFIRVFKRETGYTPYEYLLIARVNAAKFYLKTTSLAMKEVAYRCGFSSESNFCTTFKRITQKTPLGYRSS